MIITKNTKFTKGDLTRAVFVPFVPFVVMSNPSTYSVIPDLRSSCRGSHTEGRFRRIDPS